MKELEQIDGKTVQPVARVLKSLLKKPGQSKQRAHKNRVVINEKLNEFFAADYIILIKEECCGDYEEECDCCCQEPEMIRLGNCKECRAELTRQLAGGLPDDINNRYTNTPNGRINHNEESQCEDDDEEEEYEEEIDDEDEDNDEAESSEEIEHRIGNGNKSSSGANDLHCNEQLQVESSTPVQQQHQTETLSPPEGYKDVYEDDTCQTKGAGEQQLCLGPVVICGECNYYHHRQRIDGEEEIQGNKNEPGEVKTSVVDSKEDKTGDETSGDGLQSSPDVQRYVVETITMTTVTERRIVREISEEKGNIDQVDSSSGKVSNELSTNVLNGADKVSVVGETSVDDNDDNKLVNNKVREDSLEKESNDGSSSSDVCIPFKFGNTTLVANSFKPNSAVRQLFPNPRFISPPPTLNKNISDDATDSDGSERFLMTTENLRLFDLVKRGKLSGSRSDSSESDSSIIKRSIERNSTLRRNLASKYESTLKKKNLNNKDVSLEERIRQLTCVDQDEDIPDLNNTVQQQQQQQQQQNDNNFIDNKDQVFQESLPTRTSPSGEERPVKNERVVRVMSENIQETNSPSPPLSLFHQHHHHHHHYHHHHSQSAYRKITDLFTQKKLDNMPDLGIGDKNLKSSITKMNCDARKQFLSSLAPLSCVTASTGVENHQDYYQLSSKINNRDSTGYNSDSSYSLEDIEAALKGDDKIGGKNSGGPPDVTRGTPTGTGSDTSDATTDELLAFVEQDKTRTERLKRRYDTEDIEKNGNTVIKNDDGDNNDEEDDELNDYGFNRRPSVQGIKPQFETSSEIVRQIRYRTIPASIADKTRILHATSWPYYDDESLDKQKILFNKQQQLIDSGIDDNNGKMRDNTINRINTMQKQIDDIYQTIAETAVSVQGTIDRNSYLENTLSRNNITSSSSSSLSSLSNTTTVASMPPLPASVVVTQQRLPSLESHHYEQKNGLHFQDHQRIRIPDGYNSLKNNRRGTTTSTAAAAAAAATTLAISNYPCGGLIPVENTKCYRTMYLVPYNGITDPTYQNIQRILPPHSSPSYANHIERYPYPRNTSQIQQQQMPKYYSRSPQTSATNTNITSSPPPPPPPPPPPFHLHLHQPDEIRFNSSAIGMQTLQLQHHQHISQLATYNVQSLPSYTVMAPSSRTGGYHYPIHPTRITDIQSQTISLTPGLNSNYNPLGTGFNGINNLSSANSSALSSPTKIHCTSSERGVPEGAASAPSHDFLSQSNTISGHNGNTNSFIGHANNVPPPNTQNSVYYAMNV